MGTSADAMKAALDEGAAVEDEEKAAAAQAAFENAYEGREPEEPAEEAGEEQEGKPAGEEGQEAGAGDEEQPAGEEAAAAGEGEEEEPGGEEADPWEGVPDVIRQRFEEMDAKLTQANRLAGQVPALQSALARATAANTRAAGRDAPSADQIREAGRSSEKMDALREEFPDFAEALDEQFTVMREEFANRGDTITRDELHRFAEAQAVTFHHGDWQQTVKSPEFVKWAYTDGPTTEEQGRLFELDRQATTDPQAATEVAAYETELIRQYPQWWSERGSLLRSNASKDVIALLDAYEEHRSPDENMGDPTGEKGDPKPPADLSAGAGRQSPTKPSSRLTRAAAPTKGASRPTPPGKTAQQAFEERFHATD